MGNTNASQSNMVNSCPPFENPSSYPSKSELVMLQDILEPADQSTCPISVSGDVTNYCFQNKKKSDGKPFFEKAPDDSFIGFDENSLYAGPTGSNQLYLIPPVDSLKASNMQILLSPPDEKGNPQCKFEPQDCNRPMGDCTVRCKNSGALPCIDGTEPVAVGECLTHSSWNGWSARAYQCIPASWGCNYKTGKCEKMQSGGFSNELECKKKCITCPSPNFFAVDTSNGDVQCYRAPWRGLATCNAFSRYSVCRGCSGGSGGTTNDDACGTDIGWKSHCDAQPFKADHEYCTDTVKTPLGAYYCTNKGYVLCNDTDGCPGQKIHIENTSTKDHPCQLPSDAITLNQ